MCDGLVGIVISIPTPPSAFAIWGIIKLALKNLLYHLQKNVFFGIIRYDRVSMA